MGSGLDLIVTQQLADDGQALADQQRAAGEAVAEVMNSYIVEKAPIKTGLHRQLVYSNR